MCVYEKKHRWWLYSLMTVFVLPFILSFNVFASSEKMAVTVCVSGYTGAVEELRICSDESIYDSNGNAVLVKDDAVNGTFVKEGEQCKAQAELYSGVRYYVSDGVSQTMFEADGVVVDVSFGNEVEVNNSNVSEEQSEESSSEKSEEQSTKEPTEVQEQNVSTGKLGVNAKIPQAVNSGGNVKCVVDKLSGAVDGVSDTFLLQCDVPKNMELKSVYTGTYSDDVNLQLLCKTESDGKWHSWGEGIRSNTGETFETSSMNIAEGDRVCAFAISAESVPEGFTLNEEDPCYYYVKVIDESAEKDYNGTAKVTAYIGGEKSASESTFATALQTGVQTGDENYLFFGSLILMVVSFCVLLSYIVIRIVVYVKEENVERTALPVTFNKHRDRDTSEKMSSLFGKKPG